MTFDINKLPRRNFNIEKWGYGRLDSLLKHNSNSNCSFIVLCKREDMSVYTTQKYLHKPCHYNLQVRSRKEKAEWVMSTSPIEDSHGRRFIKWLTTESYWSKIFHKPSKIELPINTFIVRTDVPANLMAQALILTRLPKEYSYQAFTWSQLVDLGIEPDVAFIMSHFLSISPTFDVYEIYTGGLHTGFHYRYLSNAAIKRFLNHKPLKQLRNYREPLIRYNDIHSTWGAKRSTNDIPLFQTINNTFGKMPFAHWDCILKNGNKTGVDKEDRAKLLHIASFIGGLRHA